MSAQPCEQAEWSPCTVEPQTLNPVLIQMAFNLQRRHRLLHGGQDRVHRRHPREAGHVCGRPRGDQLCQQGIHSEGKGHIRF